MCASEPQVSFETTSFYKNSDVPLVHHCDSCASGSHPASPPIVNACPLTGQHAHLFGHLCNLKDNDERSLLGLQHGQHHSSTLLEHVLAFRIFSVGGGSINLDHDGELALPLLQHLSDVCDTNVLVCRGARVKRTNGTNEKFRCNFACRGMACVRKNERSRHSADCH